jgi:4'-phosphopantetheinyl transferase EntD
VSLRAQAPRDELVHDLFPEGVLAATAPIQPDASGLFPEEAQLVERAVASRRHEFAAGRRSARALLARLGELPAPLLRDRHRAPVWPRGVIGSISHASDRVAVAVTRLGAVRSVGIDLEHADPLEPALWAKICTATELDRLRGAARERETGLAVRLLFSAKEALYKCVHPFAQRFIGFHEVEIETTDAGRFAARLPMDVERALPPGSELEGQYRLRGSWILTGLTLRGEAPQSPSSTPS